MSALCQISNNPNMKELAGLCQPGCRPVSNTEFNSRSRRGMQGGVGGCVPTALITPPAFPKITALLLIPAKTNGLRSDARMPADASVSDMTTSQRLQLLGQEAVG